MAIAEEAFATQRFIISGNSTELVMLESFLRELENLYHIHFLFDSELVRGIVVPHSLNETSQLEYQLEIALRGTGLSYTKVSASSYVIVKKREEGILIGKISDNHGQKLIGATVRILGQDIGAFTDAQGNYQLSITPGSYQLMVNYMGFKPVRQSVEVPSGETQQLDISLSEYYTLDKVVVIGSRSTPVSIFDKAVATDMITEQQIANSPQIETSQILHYLIPSFHSTHQTISDGTDHVDPASLRGLGPDQVLVLINGKRRHSSSLVNVNGTVGRGSVGTDLNAIPASAIQKIEVLRDGAAAQYGSDAIAGVINILLKDDSEGISAAIRSGISSLRDGEELQAQTNFGIKIGKKGGFANLTLEMLSRGATNRSGDYTGPIFGDSLMINGRQYSDSRPEDVAAFFARVPFEGKKVMEMGNAALQNIGTVLNLSFPLTKQLDFYGNWMFNYRKGKSRGFYRFPYDQKRVVPELYPWGFSPEIRTNILDHAFTVGVKGEINQWKTDLSLSSGQNGFDFHVQNSNNAALGALSPTEVYAGGFMYQQYTSNLDISRKFDWGFPLNIAFGGEFRLENYRILAGEEASWMADPTAKVNGIRKEAGMQVFPGFRPINALSKYRNNLGSYVDIEADLGNLLIGVAGRFERYSDFGNNLNWKISGLYTLKKAYKVRAAISTGFRAPSLHQIYFNNLSTQYVDLKGELQPIHVGTFNHESPVSKAFGIDPLKAETSLNFSMGLTARPIKNLGLTMDLYRIYIQDRIVLSGRFGAGFEEILRPFEVAAAQFFTNAVSTNTMGLDMMGNYKLIVGSNSCLSIQVGANFTQTKVERDQDGNLLINAADVLKSYKNILFNREEVSRLESAQPRSKIISSIAYKHKKIDVNLGFTRFGQIRYVHPEDGERDRWVYNELSGRVESRDQIFSAKWITDLSASYQLLPAIRLTLGGSNIFNIYPDRLSHSANTGEGVFLYSRRVSQFGLRGAYWYSSISFAKP